MATWCQEPNFFAVGSSKLVIKIAIHSYCYEYVYKLITIYISKTCFNRKLQSTYCKGFISTWKTGTNTHTDINIYEHTKVYLLRKPFFVVVKLKTLVINFGPMYY